MKTIFKCPYEEECHKPYLDFFHTADDPVATYEFIGCHHPFIEVKGETMCRIEMEDDGDYDKIIKQISLHHKPTLKDRIKRWFK